MNYSRSATIIQNSKFSIQHYLGCFLSDCHYIDAGREIPDFRLNSLCHLYSLHIVNTDYSIGRRILNYDCAIPAYHRDILHSIRCDILDTYVVGKIV